MNEHQRDDALLAALTTLNRTDDDVAEWISWYCSLMVEIDQPEMLVGAMIIELARRQGGCESLAPGVNLPPNERFLRSARIRIFKNPERAREYIERTIEAGRIPTFIGAYHAVKEIDRRGPAPRRKGWQPFVPESEQNAPELIASQRAMKAAIASRANPAREPELIAEFRIGGTSLKRAKQILEKGIPEVVTAIERGRLAVTTAYNEIITAPDQLTKLNVILEKFHNRPPPRERMLPKSDIPPPSLGPPPPMRVCDSAKMSRLVDSLDWQSQNLAILLDTHDDYDATIVAPWIEKLRQARRTLSQAISRWENARER